MYIDGTFEIPWRERTCAMQFGGFERTKVYTRKVNDREAKGNCIEGHCFWNLFRAEVNADSSTLPVFMISRDETQTMVWAKPDQTQTTPRSKFLGRENSDHGLSLGCFRVRGLSTVQAFHWLSEIVTRNVLIPEGFMTETTWSYTRRGGAKTLIPSLQSTPTEKGNIYNPNRHLMQHLYCACVVALLSATMEEALWVWHPEFPHESWSCRCRHLEGSYSKHRENKPQDVPGILPGQHWRLTVFKELVSEICVHLSVPRMAGNFCKVFGAIEAPSSAWCLKTTLSRNKFHKSIHKLNDKWRWHSCENELPSSLADISIVTREPFSFSQFANTQGQHWTYLLWSWILSTSCGKLDAWIPDVNEGMSITPQQHHVRHNKITMRVWHSGSLLPSPLIRLFWYVISEQLAAVDKEVPSIFSSLRDLYCSEFLQGHHLLYVISHPFPIRAHSQKTNKVSTGACACRLHPPQDPKTARVLTCNAAFLRLLESRENSRWKTRCNTSNLVLRIRVRGCLLQAPLQEQWL